MNPGHLIARPLMQGEMGSRSKMTEADALRIVELRKAGKKLTEISEELSIPYSWVASVTAGRTWAKVTGIKPGDISRRQLQEKTVEDIRTALRGEEAMEDIADRFMVSMTTVSFINLGKTRRKEGIPYPIRKNRSRLKKDQIVKVQKLLKNGEHQMSAIAKVVGMPPEAVYRINYGFTGKRFYSGKYPIHPKSKTRR